MGIRHMVGDRGFSADYQPSARVIQYADIHLDSSTTKTGCKNQRSILAHIYENAEFQESR